MKSKDVEVQKDLSELSSFQLLRLFETYVQEQMQLAILIAEDDHRFGLDEDSKHEKHGILARRKMVKYLWERQFGLAKSIRFTFEEFFIEMKTENRNEELRERYVSRFGEDSFKGVEDQPWYKNVSSFEYTELGYVNLPKLVSNNRFDIVLLQKLIGCSFSCEGEYRIGTNGLFELAIEVRHDSQDVSKDLSELDDIQVLKLFEIFFIEQMNLAILLSEEDETFIENQPAKDVKKAIILAREKNSSKWMRKISRNELIVKLGLLQI